MFIISFILNRFRGQSFTIELSLVGGFLRNLFLNNDGNFIVF